jgi:hypothetical protein
MAKTTRRWRDRATWGPIRQGITTGITCPFSRSLLINRLQTSPVRTQGFLPFNTHNRHYLTKEDLFPSPSTRGLNFLHPNKMNYLRVLSPPRKRWCESSTVPRRMIRPGGLGPSAWGPSLTITTCGPIGAASPPKKGLATKTERILPKQEPRHPG